jgi:glycosyltransferase involved in cell wall biosynthesis
MISVIVAYFNRKKLFIETLKSISRTSCQNFEVIAVDDMSSEEERIEDLIGQFPFLRVYRIDKKICGNSCMAYNMGIAKAKGDIIVLQNPECLHVHDVLSYMEKNVNDSNYITTAVYSIDERIQNVLPIILRGEGFEDFIKSLPQRFAENHLGWYNHSVYRQCYFHFCAGLSRKNMNELGGFDERFKYGIGFEDTEFIYRVDGLGLHKVIADDVLVIHQWHPTAYNLENKIYRNLYRKNRTLYERTIEKPPLKIVNSYA